ncbi:zinc-dependent metalloprotease [Halobellus litoreus]|uniref:Zinc-dependent metalloprotease n=1 Tax=Halobellus litoreus TaxID=755310 RepID=A0ABD6DYY4_9EURY|nr:zinc-dependent metalloprotease [Halobellus litoreus]
MNLYRSVRAIAGASGTGDGSATIDWSAVATAAKSATDAGTLDLTAADREGYAADVRDARERLRSVGGLDFEVPETVEVQNRHHWIDANVATFRRVMRPIESEIEVAFPNATRVLNTGSMTFVLSFLGSHVLGQYDPLLLADGDATASDGAANGDDGAGHSLYFVHPNIVAAADALEVDYPRFRRWIAFHEVAHAAEFGAAPWLSEHLESRMEDGLETLTKGGFDREAFRDLDVAMTAVEGYAEMLMDRAFDAEYADLRAKLDERRRGGGPFARLARRLLGLGLKRRQYERGARFFQTVADRRGVAAAAAVWERPENLPTSAELDDPAQWLARVDP